MSGPLLLITTAIYGWVAAEQAWSGNWPMSLVFGAYAAANVGMMFAVK